jgi:glutamate--cysteine ligase
MTEIHSILADIVSNKNKQIEDWFQNEYTDVNPMFFVSVDIRDSGSKVAPIDTNVFPAGFNNISTEDLPAIGGRAQDFLDGCKAGNKILLIPEEHTRNQFYLDSLQALKKILEHGGREVEISTQDGLIKNGRVLEITETKFIPDAIVLNNDFSGGAPEILKDIEQPVMPHLSCCWDARTKSQHFESYQTTLERFCSEFSVDPFLLSAKFFNCGNVNFQNSKGLDCIAHYVDKMIFLLKEGYKKHGIDDDPYVFVKADSGTYGLGIISVSSGDEIHEMNRKNRKKMHVIKDGTVNSKVIIQEGIRTEIQHEGSSAEPMIYMLGGRPIQNLLRINSEKDAFSNLNRSGARFIKKNLQNQHSYNIVSRLASLAAASEST